MKENAQKKRKERFNPANDVSMVERIAERKKEMEEAGTLKPNLSS